MDSAISASIISAVSCNTMPLFLDQNTRMVMLFKARGAFSSPPGGSRNISTIWNPGVRIDPGIMVSNGDRKYWLFSPPTTSPWCRSTRFTPYWFVASLLKVSAIGHECPFFRGKILKVSFVSFHYVQAVLSWRHHTP